MGWWGAGIFSGDSPMDLIGDFCRYFQAEIQSKKEKDPETVPAIIFLYADFCQRFRYRSGMLKECVDWLRTYEASGWKDNEERKSKINKLANDIESMFCLDKEGYKNPKDYRQVDIQGTNVYHLTKKENTQSIIEKGLEAQECWAGFFKNKSGIYVSKSLMGCLKWRFHCLGENFAPEAAIVKFTIMPEDVVFQDQRVDFKDDFIVCNNVEQNRLEILS